MPLIVRRPEGTSEQDTVDVLTEHFDLSATIRDIADADQHEDFEGRSLQPLLDGDGPRPGRNVVFSENYGFGMARTQTHKLVFHEDTLTPCQLFDLDADATEDENLIDSGDHAGVIDEMMADHVRPFLAGGRVTGDSPALFG